MRTQLTVIGGVGGLLAIVGVIVLGAGSNAFLGLLCLVAAAAIFAGMVQFVRTEKSKHDEQVRKAAEDHEKLVQAHRTAVQAARGRFEQELAEWRGKAERVQQARIKWELHMYYCHRHDVVFLADGQTVARPDDMPELLDIAGIPLESVAR